MKNNMLSNVKFLIRSITFTVIIFIPLIFSCQKSEPCLVADRTAVKSENLSAPNNGVLALQNVNDSNDVSLIIDNQNDYEKFVKSSTTLPVIDFTNQILVAGRKKWHQCLKFQDQQLTEGCNKVYYHVNLSEMDCEALSHYDFFAIISSEYGNRKIEFQINVQ